MIEYGYINEQGFLVSKILNEHVEHREVNGEVVEYTYTIEEQIAELTKQGWKPVDLIDETRLKAENEFSVVWVKPVDNGDRISYSYEETFDKKTVVHKIEELKKELETSDYKILKCYEANLLNNPMPYPFEEITHTRQTLRDEINRLEEML